MGFWNVFQRNTSNDDLNAQDRPLNERKGYLGDTEHISAGDVNTPANPDYQEDGGGEQVINGWRQAGTNAYDQDVDRYRKMGDEGQTRGPVRVNQTQSNESRGLMSGALGLLRRQGEGSAPSAAEIMSGRANQNAVAAAGQQVTSARGTGNRIAAAQTAGAQAGQQSLAANAANADMRAAEISHGQNAYAGGTTGLRAQDIGVATQDAQLDAQQRALNEARQQAMEKRAWDTRNTQQQGADRYSRDQQAQDLARSQQDAAQSGADWDRGINNLKTATAIGASVPSDPKTKEHIHSMTTGGLGGLYRSRGC